MADSFMASFIGKVLRLNPFRHSDGEEELPQPLPFTGSQRLVRVFVEGYDDVAFWRSIFDHFANPYLRFEISVPNREDLPKGKKVLLSMVPSSGEDFLLCMDSDFDYLMGGETEDPKGEKGETEKEEKGLKAERGEKGEKGEKEESRSQNQNRSQGRNPGPGSEQVALVNNSPYLFHTYAYATENYLCYAPSLHNVCVKATKNDTRIFDFVRFLTEYSCLIYPAFLWYVYSARQETQHVFMLVDFKNTVRLGYLDIRDNGEATLQWVGRNVERCCKRLSAKYPEMADRVVAYGAELAKRGLRPDNTYLFMHGHTLLDNVVMVLLQTVCEQLRRLSIEKIHSSKKRGVAFNNEISNYKNAQRSIRDVLLDNDNYTSCYLYKRLHRDIERYIRNTVDAMKRRGEIPSDGKLEFPLTKRLKELRELRTLQRK